MTINHVVYMLKVESWKTKTKQKNITVLAKRKTKKRRLYSEKIKKWLDDFGRMNTKRQTQRMVQVLEIIHSRGVQERKGA